MKKAVSNLDSACSTGNLAWGLQLHRVLAILMLLILTTSALVTLIVVPFPSRAASTASTTSALFDDFTQDTSLNTSQWQINGPAGSLFGPADCSSCSLIPLEPTFSSVGMEIAQVNTYFEVGTIQSISSFTPPFNLTAVVEGTVSVGHTFVLAISSADASSGVDIQGNLNPHNCSHLDDCGNRIVCGEPANSSITPNECRYGMNVFIGEAGGPGHWAEAPELYFTPSVNVVYAIQISVNASGRAQYSISQEGHVLGESYAQIGEGPFYVMLAQGEGAPLIDAGPNVAYWKSVSLNSPLTERGLNVYPTESSFTTMTLNYSGQSLSSPIHVAVVKDTDFPLGLNVTLRAQGTRNFTKTLDLQPSDTGSSTIMLNVTLDCVTGKCDKSGGTQLPMTQDVNITASSGSYRQEGAIQIHLLKAKWLVMVYSAADTGTGPTRRGDLQASMMINVQEMATVSGLHNNPAVGMLDLFAMGWDASFTHTAPGTTKQDGDTIRLYQVSNGTIRQVGGTWPETAMNDPNTLIKFINNATTLVPADRNQLIISDHGAGIQGVAPDFHNGHTSMSIPQLATALDGVSPKLDVLSFDACLMAQIDVLYQLRNYASYFTASELTVPGGGYNYIGFLGSLLTNPDQSTVNYVKGLVSTYNAKYSAPPPNEENATLAAINASSLGGVVSALNTLSGLLVQHYSANDGEFNATMLLVLARSTYADEGFQYVDTRSLAQNILLSPQITDQSVRNAATAVIQATEAAVIANSTNYWIKGRSITSLMYEGLTVLLWQKANVPKLYYQVFEGFDNQLSFSTAAQWLPLLRCVNRSASASEAAWTLILLVHPGHQLFLSAYNSASGQTGINPGLLGTTPVGNGVDQRFILL